MTPFESNPFATLTLIAAPAVLTNACSLLALNTANRFGRAIDRSRWLTAEMDRLQAGTDEYAIRQKQFERVSRRGVWLLRAQTALYAAIGLLTASALTSVVGAITAAEFNTGFREVGMFSLALGAAAVLCLLFACGVLVHETRLAVLNLSDDVALLAVRHRARTLASAPAVTPSTGL
jgi:hypothetical protein